MGKSRKIRIKQHDISDCGAACLASVSAYYGLNMPVSRIRQFAGTDKHGSNITGMLDASEKLGFLSKGVRLKKEYLNTVPLPAIAHLVLKDSWHHFVVIYRCGKNSVHIMDPASGCLEKWNLEKFNNQWTGIILLITPAENFKNGNFQISNWQRFILLIKPHRSVVTQATAGAVFYSILGLSTSIYVEKLIDYVIPSGNIKLLNLMTLALIVFLVFRVVIGYLKSVFMLRSGQKIDALLILGYYRHILKLPQRFFDTMRIGEIISRVNDAIKIRTFINNAAVEIMVNLLILIFTFSLMMIYSREMSFRMLSILPFFILIYIIYNKLNKKYLRATMEQAAEMESRLVESLTNIDTIKKFQMGRKENLKFELKIVPLLKSSFIVNKSGLMAGSSSEMVSGIFIMFLLWSGTNQIFRQNLTPGELMSFYALFGYMINPLHTLLQSNRFIQDALIAADRLFQVLDLEQENEFGNMAEPEYSEITKISFENVCFRYGSSKNLFSNLNLEFEMNRINGINGQNGSGKSTILSLLQGVYPVTHGRILFGNFDLQNIKKSSLKTMMSCVPQKTEIFSGSLAENIAVGELQTDMTSVIRVCHESGVLEAMENFPSGFNTLLGDNGVKPSGGELQKIAIARALYCDADIYLFDEPSSSMDKYSEENLKSLLINLKKKRKTIIIVTHCNSLLEVCDVIHNIENGIASRKMQSLKMPFQ